MCFIYRNILGGPVNFACGGMDHFCAPAFPCCLKDVVCSFDVCFYVRERRDIRIWDAYKRGKMEDGITTRHSLLYQIEIPDISGDDFHVVSQRRFFKPPPGVPGIVADKSTDRMAFLY